MLEEKFRPRAFPLYAAAALITAGLLAYSQAFAFAWDEGFHLVAAQLIKAGSKPYIDFMFPQAPLNAYWNAFWMQITRESWRTAHALAAIESGLSALLTGLFALRRFPVIRWRSAAAFFCAVLVGANFAVVQFGTVSQAYGFCLLAMVGAFWFATLAVDRSSLLAFAAGLASGIAAGGSLLTAPVAPVLLLWMSFCNRAGNRWWKSAAFLSGVVAAFVPVLRLLAAGPRQTWFCIVQYHLHYRQVEWEGAVRHDLETMAGLIDSPQVVLLLLLAVFGILFVWFRSAWERARRQEFYLCALLAAALAAHISSAHPTFARYYLLTTPFLSYLAAAGIYFAGSALWSMERPWLPVLVLCGIVTANALKDVYDIRNDMGWRDLEAVSARVREVARPDRPLLADEAVYFILHRRPEAPLASRDSHKLKLPPDQEQMLHIISHTGLQREVEQGKYNVAEFCEEEGWFDEEHLTPLFRNKAEVGDCRIFWDWKGR